MYSSTDDLAAESLVVAGVAIAIPLMMLQGLLIGACLVVVWWVFCFLVGTGWGQLVSLVGSAYFFFTYNTFSWTQEAFSVVPVEAVYTIPCWISLVVLGVAFVFTLVAIFAGAAEVHVGAAFIFISPFLLLMAIGGFWDIADIDLIPFFDLPDKIGYAGVFLRKG